MQQATTPVPGFGYAYAAGREDKTPAEIEDSVNALVDGMVDVTSKNGVTLLSVAPKADGTLPDSQVRILKKLGGWMQVNKEALYGADCRTPCAAGTLRFTRKGPCLYAIDLKEPTVPTVIPGVTPVQGSNIRMLGSDKNLAWRQVDGNVVIEELPDPLPCDHAWVFTIRVDEMTDSRLEIHPRSRMVLEPECRGRTNSVPAHARGWTRATKWEMTPCYCAGDPPNATHRPAVAALARFISARCQNGSPRRTCRGADALSLRSICCP